MPSKPVKRAPPGRFFSFLALLALAAITAGCGTTSAPMSGPMRARFAADYCAVLTPPQATASAAAASCEGAVAAALPPAFDAAAGAESLKVIRAAHWTPPSCSEPAAVVTTLPVGLVVKAVPLDAPKAAAPSDVPTVVSVVLAADGSTQIDARTVPSDEAILAAATAAHATNPELRVVIKADSAVPHGRVIHVLDLLKRAGVAKVAFGVSPVTP